MLDCKYFLSAPVVWIVCLFAVYRKKLKGTCDYIYQTLFLDGEGSDVTIEALGKFKIMYMMCMCIYILYYYRLKVLLPGVFRF